MGRFTGQMGLYGSTVLTIITLSQLTGLLQQLGFRAKVISPALIESASNGWVWQVELWPLEEAETLVFKAEMFVAHDVVADINRFLRVNPLCVPTYKKLDDGTTEVQLRAVHSLFGGVTVDHVNSWIEQWTASLDWITEDLMYL